MGSMSAGNVLEMSVLRGVGGMCMARGGVGGVVGDRIGFGFGLYQFWRNMGNVGYASVFWLLWCWGSVGGQLGPGSGRVVWCYVCVCCESGFSVLMAAEVTSRARESSALASVKDPGCHLYIADMPRPTPPGQEALVR